MTGNPGAEDVPQHPPAAVTASRAAAVGSDGRRGGGRIGHAIAEYGVLIALALMIAGFALYLPDTFPTWDNARSVISDQAVLGILALAVILPLTSGEFDLSVGANLGFVTVFAAYVSSHGMSLVPLIVLSILVGACIGVVNASLVLLGVNAFIATLGTGTILTGGNLLLTDGTTIYEGIDESFTTIAQTEILGLRLTVFYFLAIALLVYYLLEWTPVGRYLRATGLGREAARLTGVRTSMWLGSSFIAAGALAGLAGLLNTATVGSASPTVGPEFLLPAYAAAFLGATTIRRGFFNVWGTIVGVFLLAVGTSGLALAGAPFWVQPVFNGAALIAAVTWAVLAARRRGEPQA